MKKIFSFIVLCLVVRQAEGQSEKIDSAISKVPLLSQIRRIVTVCNQIQKPQDGDPLTMIAVHMRSKNVCVRNGLAKIDSTSVQELEPKLTQLNKNLNI